MIRSLALLDREWKKELFFFRVSRLVTPLRLVGIDFPLQLVLGVIFVLRVDDFPIS